MFRGLILSLAGLACVVLFQNFDYVPYGSDQKNLPLQSCQTNATVNDYQATWQSPVPQYLANQSDPVFPAWVKRITPNAGTIFPKWNFVVGDIFRHQYSKVAAWNSNGTLLRLSVNQQVINQNGIVSTKSVGTPVMYLNGLTYDVAGTRPPPSGRLVWERWHPANEPSAHNLIFYARNNSQTEAEFGYWNVLTGVVTRLRSFTGYQFVEEQNAEGNVANDASTVALAARSIAKKGRMVALVFGINSAFALREYDLNDDVDNVTISSSGRYLVVNGCWQGYQGCKNWENSDRTLIYDTHAPSLNSSIWFSEFGRPSHFDVAIDQDGQDVVVGVSKCGTTQNDSVCQAELGSVIKRRLSDGVVTRLTPKVHGDKGGWAVHTSTRNIFRPGWAYVSYQRINKTNPGYWGPYFDEVVAVKLDGSLTVERLARTFNTSGVENVKNEGVDYWAQTQAVPSSDGRRVLFTSNFGRLHPSTSTPGNTSEFVAYPCVDGKMISPH